MDILAQGVVNPGNLGVCQLFRVVDMMQRGHKHPFFSLSSNDVYAAQLSCPTAQRSGPAVGTDTGFLEEEMERFMASGPYGHGVPAGLVSHHTEPAWAVTVMLSILQRLRSHMPNTAGECMPTKKPLKFAKQFVRHLCQLVREDGGMNVETQTFDPTVLEHTLICWLHHKIDSGDWRSYTMTSVAIHSAAHETVKTLSAAHEAVETFRFPDAGS